MAVAINPGVFLLLLFCFVLFCFGTTFNLVSAQLCIDTTCSYNPQNDVYFPSDHQTMY